MTEAEWLAGSDPEVLLSVVLPGSTYRKFKWWCAACCRMVWPYLVHAPLREALEVFERSADLLASEEALQSAHAAADRVYSIVMPRRGSREYSAATAIVKLTQDDESVGENQVPGIFQAAEYASHVAAWDGEGEREGALLMQAHLLRDLFGNPFRPVTIESGLLTWRDATSPKLAQAAYEERELPGGHLDAGRLAILADALEEAGCTSEDVLSHLRGPGPHVRGCWVVDLLLGKE